MYRGGPGGEACEDERKLKNVTETVCDACHGPFFAVLSGVLFLLSCQEQCDVREYARVYRGKIELWDPKMLIKAGKSSKNRAFWAQGAKIVLWDP